mmetsp:Transcript_73570/g.137474  ORF Transcript_73570/g.137474 Transcript_73570/m.137474 type:complete len:414 (-) Transcript_73570:88-1329(-)
MQAMWLTLWIYLAFMATLGRCLEESVCPQDVVATAQIAAQSSSLVQANTKRASSRTVLQEESHDLPAGRISRKREAGIDPGLVVVRVPKTGSTTLQAVAERIGSIYNGTVLSKKRSNTVEELFSELGEGNSTPASIIYTGHGRLKNIMPVLQESVPKSEELIKIAMVRDPAERCMSSFYHLLQGWHEEREYGDKAKVAWLEGRCTFFERFEAFGECQKLKCPDFVVGYLAPFEDATLKETFNAYTLLGVTERFEESLVILSQKLRLPLADVLYVKLKEAGADQDCGVARTASKNEHVPLEEEAAEVQAAAQKLREGQDMQFYRLVNANLNKNIEEYPGDFTADLSLFRSWLAIAAEQCQCIEDAHTREVTGADGHEYDASFDCIDALVRTEGWKIAPKHNFSAWMDAHRNATA